MEVAERTRMGFLRWMKRLNPRTLAMVDLDLKGAVMLLLAVCAGWPRGSGSAPRKRSGQALCLQCWCWGHLLRS